MDKDKEMTLKLQWKQKTGQHQDGESLYLNKIIVGSYNWNILRPQGSDEPAKYVGRINLPSSKLDRIYSATVEDVKIKVVDMVIAWFKEALAP